MGVLLREALSAELSGLKTLHLKGTKVTDDGVKDLKKTLTKVEIDH